MMPRSTLAGGWLSTAMALVCFIIPSPAHATGSSIGVYDVRPATPATGLSSGQILGASRTCTKHRRYKLVARARNGRTSVLDHGETSSEGVLAGFFLNRDALAARSVYFKVPATATCPSVMASLPDQGRQLAANRSRSVGTEVQVIGVNGLDGNGAIMGFLELKKQAECFAGRRMKLSENGRVFDSGRSSANGAWALHLTRHEYESSDQVRIGVSRSKSEDRGICQAAGVTVRPSKVD